MPPKLCSPECDVICDFCIHFNGNFETRLSKISGKMRDYYTGDGYCEKHKRPQDICGGCDDFHCFKLEEVNASNG